MTKPSFVGIGAQKCASTWLYDILRDHPQARLSEQKELNFFCSQFDRGFQWYERQFPPAGETMAVGEISPAYFHEPAVPARIRSYLPGARIVVSLRDPVERALSHHRHAVRIGDVSGEDLSFESALAMNPMYLEQGRYATHLARWLEYFPRDRILILFYEDIIADPAMVARRVYAFLGIDPNHRSGSLLERSNGSHVTPYMALERGRRALRHGARRLGLGPVWERLAVAGGRRVYRRLNRRPSEESIPALAEGTRAALRAFFREEIDRLQNMTGRDLTEWRRGTVKALLPKPDPRSQLTAGSACP